MSRVHASVRTYVVYFDGVQIPVESVTFSANLQAGISGYMIVRGSKDTLRIRESTRVDIWTIDSRRKPLKRKSVEIDLPPESELLTYLQGDFSEQMRQTIDGHYPIPEFPREDSLSPFQDVADPSMWAARATGEVVSIQEQKVPGTHGAVIAFQGVQKSLNDVKIIQMIRGTGSFTDVERRFFGQSEEAERSRILSGRGRRAFADALVDLLTDTPGGFASGLRRILMEYGTSIAPFHKHRFWINRVLNQMSVINDDQTIDRLADLQSFKKFMRDTLQQGYMMPALSALSTCLEFFKFRMVAVPSPPFFPLVPAPRPTTTTVEEEVPTPAAGHYDVQWTGWEQQWVYGSGAPVPESPGRLELVSAGVYSFTEIISNPDALESAPDLYSEADPITVHRVTIRAGTTRGTISGSGQNLTLRFTIPSSSITQPAGVNYIGPSGMSFSITNDDLVRVDVSDDPNRRGSASTAATQNARTLAQYADFRADTPDLQLNGDALPVFETQPPSFAQSVVLRLTVTPRDQRTAAGTRTVTRRVEVPAEAQEGEYRADFCALHSLAVLPDLWWACPPACNVVIPEEMYQTTFVPAPRPITRLLAKIPPGMAGSRQTFVDKFVAPNRPDLNAALTESDADPTDTDTLMYEEHDNGIIADVMYVDRMSRQLRQPEFERYMRAMVTHEFWSRRVGGNRMTISCRPSDRFVIGAPILVLRGVVGDVTQSLTPEQASILARIRSLRALRRALSRCIARYQSLVAAAQRLIDYLEACAVTSGVLSRRRQIISGADEAVPRNIVGRSNDDGTFTNVNLTQLGNGLRGNIEVQRRSDTSVTEDVNTDIVVEGETFSLNRTLGFLPQGITGDLITSYLGAEVAGMITPIAGVVRTLPTAATLLQWRNEVRSRLGAFRSCLTALLRDRGIVDDEISSLESELEDTVLEATRANGPVLGLLTSIQEQTTAGNSEMTLDISHARVVGEDFDSDLLAGDDFENIIAFGQDGNIDEKYSTSRIGQDVYVQSFGCGSLFDAGFGQVAEGDETSIDDGGGSDISDIMRQMRHPSVCGHSCMDEADSEFGGTVSNPSSVALDVQRAYEELSNEDADVVDWVDTLGARAHMGVGDAYRSTVIRTAQGYAGSPSPVEIDYRANFSEGEVPEGLWRKSIPQPDTGIELFEHYDEMGDDERRYYLTRHRTVVQASVGGFAVGRKADV